MIDPKTCAIIIIDMQNAFVAPGSVFETPGAREMIPRLTELINFARNSRIPIIWTQSDHSPPYGGNMLKKFPVIANQQVLWPTDTSFNFYPNMPQPHETELEHVIVKHKYDAFFETTLDAILRFHHSDTVIISGTATNACCESTARSAFMRDYNVVFLSDLTATFDSVMHQATLRNIDLLFGRVVTTAELLNELSARRADSLTA